VTDDLVKGAAMNQSKGAVLGAVIVGLSCLWVHEILLAQSTPKQCATRLSFAITGKAPTPAFLGSADPQLEGAVRALVDSEDFRERFARFANSQWNEGPGANSQEDATYHMVKHTLTTKLPWKNVFVGPYNVVDDNNNVRVESDSNGLGYTRSRAWMERYAGNEGDGVRISTAYRVMQNSFGVELGAINLPAGADTTVNGRNVQQPCKSCHFDQVTALDPASVPFPRVIRSNNQVSFGPPNTNPVDVLGGNTVIDDTDFMNLLAESIDAKYHACQLAYKYLTGRKEFSCDKSVMDSCLAAFESTGQIEDALVSIATDKTYCE